MQLPPPRPLPSSNPAMVITSIPALSNAVFLPKFRSYAITTPGSSATTLLPSSHCSRSASNESPPVSITRILSAPTALPITSGSHPRCSSVTRSSAEDPGRTDQIRAPLITFGNNVTRSRSHIVITVSRCIYDRDFGRCTASTCLADPARNNDRAIHNTACGVVRSPIPIITVPLPIGCTSPPSTWHRPQSSSDPPSHTGNSSAANIGWNL